MQSGSDKKRNSSLLNKWLNRKKKTEKPKGVQPRPIGVKVPLSLGQKRLLFLQQLHPENPFYHYADAYRFKGVLDIEKLIKSFEIAAQRHEILRTKIVIENGQAFQQFNEKPLFEVSKFDLRHLSENELENESKKIAIREARKPLESPEGYLIRLSIICLTDNENILIVTLHHIVMDKWSMRVLQYEVAQYYQNLISEEEINIPQLEIQYADYAYWQSLQEANSFNIDYWTKKLENSSGILGLQTDFQRPAKPTFRGAYSTQSFSSELSNKLKEFCIKSNNTLYVVLLTAYKILLKNYSGQTDILVGSPFTNRNEIALENLIGFFNETLVMRSDLSDDPKFTDLLGQVWTTTQEAFAHKDMPFENLVKALNVDRDLNYNPLFQVMFIYHDVPEKTYFGKKLDVEQEPFDFGVTKFDLTLFIAEDQDLIKAIFEYSKDLFDESTIAKMHESFTKLLEDIIDNPNRPISEFSIVTNNELETFSEWNDTNTNNIEAKSFVELFNSQVRNNPENIAISFQNKHLTYSELNQQSNSVANYLIGLNLEKNKPIGILVEQSLDMIIGILGILKAGFAYLPLNADYPKDRLNYIIQDSNSAVILTQKHLQNFVSYDSIKIKTIEKLIHNPDSSEPILQSPIAEEDLAYVIYTSGSTGQPKGVSITHKNLLYSTSARFDFYKEAPQSFLLLSSFSFDSSVAGIFWTLSTGGKLVLAERRVEQDLDKLSDIFVNETITHTLLLPTLYSTILNNLPNEKFNSFNTVIVAGEAPSKTLCKLHFETLPNVKLYNEYGPTEATVWATAHQMEPSDSESNIPIGKPVSNTQIYILDENQKRVPIGISGEMYIGGKGLAKGYFNNQKLSEKRFPTISIANKKTERLYQTGDICRYRNDGVIEFLGRKDNQIKLRGYRIELDEIKEIIKQNENVTDIIVKLETIDNVNNQDVLNKTQRLVAYFIAEKPLIKNDFTEFLQNKLPNYMIPSSFVQIEEFPKLPNGKIDINSLVYLEEENCVKETNLISPKSETEKRLVEIWEEVLNFKPIGIKDNFFGIGGDSILSIQIISKARKQGIILAPNQLFEHQTIAELALFAKNETNTFEQEPIVGETPMLPIQHWFFDEHKNSPNHWNQGFLIDIPNYINSEICKKAVKKIINHHDALRMRFSQKNQNWNAFTVNPNEVNAFTEIDLGNIASNDINALIFAKSKEIQSNLNLSESSLFHAILFNCGETNSNKLLLFAHHLVIDHISWQIVLSDLETILKQFNNGKENEFLEKTTSYKKWSKKLYDLSKSGEFDSEIDFWKDQLVSESIPTDFEFNSPAEENSIKTIDLEIDSDTTENLLTKCNETYNTKPIEILLTAFIQAFKKWSSNRKLCIGIERHGRKYDKDGFDLSNTVGWFTTYFPLLLEIEEVDSYKSNVITTKEKLRDIPNEGLGFGVLKYLSGIKELDQKPQVIFNYLGNQRVSNFEVLGDSEFVIEGVRSTDSERHHILEVNSFVENNQLKVKFSFSENVHKSSSIKDFLTHFKVELSKLIEHCLAQESTEYTPSDFPEAELNQDDLANLFDQLG